MTTPSAPSGGDHTDPEYSRRRLLGRLANLGLSAVSITAAGGALLGGGSDAHADPSCGDYFSGSLVSDSNCGSTVEPGTTATDSDCKKAKSEGGVVTSEDQNCGGKSEGTILSDQNCGVSGQGGGQDPMGQDFNCGKQQGAPGAEITDQDADCGNKTTTSSSEVNNDASCTKPGSGTSHLPDNDCGKAASSPSGFSEDNRCGMGTSQTGYFLDNDCGKQGGPALPPSGDSDCGTSSGPDQSPHADGCCGKTTSGAYWPDARCGHTKSSSNPEVWGDEICGKLSAAGGNDEDQDCGQPGPNESTHSDSSV